MVITYITYVTISIAIFLLGWYLFSPGAKELVEQDWKEYEEDRKWQEWKLAEQAKYSMGAAEDWEILAYYTPKVFDWLEDKIELSEADKAVCHELRQKLEMQCQWKDKNNKMRKGVPASKYEAIRIMNKKTDKTFIISWKDNEVIAGTWIEFGAYSEYIRVEDSI